MNATRRTMVVGAAALGIGGTIAPGGRARAQAPTSGQPYPNRPVKLLVGYVPGPTGPDYAARVMAERLGQILGQPFVVENKPGASGTIATTAAVQAAPDGYTLLIGETGQLEIAPFLYKSLPYNVLSDLTPISLVTDAAGIVLISNPKLTTARTLQELIAEAKANPGKLRYGSAGIGSIHHIAMESFKEAFGLDIVHVPYKGGGQTVPAFLGGEVSVLPGALQTFRPHIRAGNATLLAAISPRRLPAIPDTPAISELAPDYGFESQIGILGPAKLPAEIVDKLSDAIRTALAMPDLREKLGAEGTRTIRWTTGKEYGDIIRANLKRYERAVRIANIQPE